MQPIATASNNQFLNGLERIDSALLEAQQRITSGLRVSKPSDDPAALREIISTQSHITQTTQMQANYGMVKTELQVGDSALQQAIKSLEQAVSLAMKSAGTLSDEPANVLLSQVKDIQEQLVGLSRTVVAGRYIFSGDLDQEPLYELDSSTPAGVSRLATASTTYSVQDATGSKIWQSKTAQEIFDKRNPDGTPAEGNVFAAVAGLAEAIANRDGPAAQLAAEGLKAAEDHLNVQLGLYGIAENRLEEATALAANSVIWDQQRLSELRDTDVPAEAIRMNQATLQQQAAMSAKAKASQVSLFDFLA